MLRYLIIPQDKQGHFIVGVLAYMIVHFINIYLALGFVFILAIGKEIYDWFYRDKHIPETLDAVATILGGIAGYICSL